MLQTNFEPFPILYTRRLTLRRITTADAGELFTMRSNPEIMQHIDRPIAKAVDDAVKLIGVIEDRLLAGDGITWGITLTRQPELIGTIGLWRIVKEDYRAEIGYLLHPDRQRQGIMQEALEKVLDYGFAVMNLHSVEGTVKPSNVASQRLLEKNGFVREAYFKENYYYEGKFCDSAIYSLLTPFR